MASYKHRSNGSDAEVASPNTDGRNAQAAISSQGIWLNGEKAKTSTAEVLGVGADQQESHSREKTKKRAYRRRRGRNKTLNRPNSQLPEAQLHNVGEGVTLSVSQAPISSCDQQQGEQVSLKGADHRRDHNDGRHNKNLGRLDKAPENLRHLADKDIGCDSDIARASNNKRKKHKKHKRYLCRDAVVKDATNNVEDQACAAPQNNHINPASQSETPKSDKPYRTERHVHPNAPLYAALDLGTNNCRLLVATPTRPGHFRVVDSFSRIVRLGEGLASTGRLGEVAIERAIDALKICKTKLSQHNIRRARLVATEACRVAENSPLFVQRVKDEAGIELEVVDRKTEAQLAVSGCGTLVERDTEAIVLFDIGGGSSEIALIDVSHRRSPRLAEHITAWTSLPVGVVTLAEQFGGRHVSIEDFYAMTDHVSQLLQQFTDRHKLGDLVCSPNFHLLGTSGTVTTLAGLHLDLPRYDRRRVDGIWLMDDEVTRMTDKLLSWTLDQRMANPCIGADRADLVLAGCAILEAIRKVWPCPRLRVADRGLREGILTELMSRDGAWRHYRNRQFSRGRHYLQSVVQGS